MNQNKIKKIIREIEKIEQQEDLIGREEFVNHILKLINISNEKKSWTFAINGEWGCGKSFVINMIKEKLNNSNDKIVIKYDAWKNDFYQDPLIAILYNLLDFIELNTKLDSFLNPIKNGIGIISSLLNYIPNVKELKENTKDLIKYFNKTYSKNDKIEITNEFISYNDSLQILKNLLNDITKNHKLIILVDELDRCEPSYALTVLNRLHHLFNLPKIIVIVAVNKHNLKKMIKTSYGDESDNYLDKFFDITLTLTSKGKKDILKHKTKKFLSSFNLDVNDKYIQLYISLIRSYIHINARNINKLFEHLKFIIENIFPSEYSLTYILLITYLWLKAKKEKNKNILTNIDIPKKAENVFSYLLINFFNEPNTYFDGEFLFFIQKNTTNKKYLGSACIRISKDEDIDNFLGLLNLYRFRKYNNSFRIINNCYETNFNENDLEKLNNIYSLINLLLEN